MNKIRMIAIAAFAAAPFIAGIGAATAQGGGDGPVASACAGDIAAHCSGIQHTTRAVRTCLEGKRDKLSAACKAALDGTGPGRGMGGMGGMGRGPGSSRN